MSAELRVSVVITTYNRAHLVGRALGSVLNEVGPNDEVLVIDDGSTDDTKRVVEEFGDRRVRYIFQSNAGAGAARNRGAREATGDLLCYLDSDDEWLPGKIALQRPFMTARPDVLFCFTDLAGESGGWRQRRYGSRWHTDPRSWEEIMGRPAMYSSVAKLPPGITDFKVYTGNIYRGEMHTNYLSTITIMIRRRDAGDAIHFCEGVRTYEDWECFGRLARRGLAAYLDYETSVNHTHPGPRLTDAARVVCAESRLVVLRNVWGADPEFLAAHGDEYRALVHEQELQRVRGLIILGRVREARREVHKLRGVPLAYRLLCCLPGGLVSSFVALRRAGRIRLARTAFTLARRAEQWAS